MIPGGDYVDVLYEILTLLSLCVFFIATCCALYAFIRMVKTDLSLIAQSKIAQSKSKWRSDND